MKPLPVVVLSNTADLRFLSKELKLSSNYKKTCQEVITALLEKYKLKEIPEQEEFAINVPNLWLVLILLVSIILNIYFLFFR